MVNEYCAESILKTGFSLLHTRAGYKGDINPTKLLSTFSFKILKSRIPKHKQQQEEEEEEEELDDNCNAENHEEEEDDDDAVSEITTTTVNGQQHHSHTVGVTAASAAAISSDDDADADAIISIEQSMGRLLTPQTLQYHKQLSMAKVYVEEFKRQCRRNPSLLVGWQILVVLKAYQKAG